MSAAVRHSFNFIKYSIHCKQCIQLCNNVSKYHFNYNRLLASTHQPILSVNRYLSSNTWPTTTTGQDQPSAGDHSVDDNHYHNTYHTIEDHIDNSPTTTLSEDTVGVEVMFKHNTNVTSNGSVIEPTMIADQRVKDFWKEHDINVHGREPPLPVLDMNGYAWPQPIQQALEADGFDAPTPIQCQGWPIVLSGRDMVGVAQTGSGKTLCYVLPAFVKIVTEGVQRGPKCLVLAPTRELAQQIHSVVRRYRCAASVCLFGGASRLPQMQILRENNPQILIATPGRMNDFVESGVVDLRSVDYLVLDEADRMLDMGFEPQIRRIIDQIPAERQTVMWSATWPKEVKELAAQYMRDYVQVNVGGNELMANKNIEQIVEVCEEFEKKPKLFEVLNKINADSPENKTLIFVRTKQSVDYITNTLQSRGLRAVSIHGDKTQAVRDRVLSDFRSNRFPILVATDVAARGLDVDDIKFVINFDYPNTGEDYVHRIGRTGRRDKKGTAFTFLSSEEARQANELIDILRESNQQVNPKLLEMAEMSRNAKNVKKPRFGGVGGAGGYGYQNGYQQQGFRGQRGGGRGGYQNRNFVQREGQFNNQYGGGVSAGGPPRRRQDYESFYGQDSQQSMGASGYGYDSRQQTQQPSEYKPNQNYRPDYRQNYRSNDSNNYGNTFGNSSRGYNTDY